MRGDVGLAMPSKQGVTIQLRQGRTITAGKLVIAAGAWSHLLAQQFGDRVPLETERGYNTTLPEAAFDLKRQLIFAGHGFVITPLDTGIRVGGAVELGGLKRPPNFARSEAMLEKASASCRASIRPAGASGWASARRCPTRCRSSAARRPRPSVFYAFGHGHLGLTQSAATGTPRRRPRDRARPCRSISTPFSAQRF